MTNDDIDQFMFGYYRVHLSCFLETTSLFKGHICAHNVGVRERGGSRRNRNCRTSDNVKLPAPCDEHVLFDTRRIQSCSR